VAHMECRNM